MVTYLGWLWGLHRSIKPIIPGVENVMAPVEQIVRDRVPYLAKDVVIGMFLQFGLKQNVKVDARIWLCTLTMKRRATSRWGWIMKSVTCWIKAGELRPKTNSLFSCNKIRRSTIEEDIRENGGGSQTHDWRVDSDQRPRTVFIYRTKFSSRKLWIEK